jgi:hypothetical protein
VKQRALRFRKHFVETLEDFLDARLSVGCGLGAIPVCSYLGMRARLLLLAAALAAFGASLGSGFHFDDYAIFSDPVLISPHGWLTVWTARTRPLTYFTYWLNYQAGGQNPLGYHILNLALHLVAVWLAYECLTRILPAHVAWFAAAIFAVHPLQAESVDYIWGRGIVLAAVFCFGALWCWIDDRPWLALACFAAALMAKEECSAFPLMLFLLPKELLPRPRHQGVVITMMLAAGLAAGLRVVWAAAATPGAQAGAQAGISPWNYLLSQSAAILRYLRLLVVPVGFTIEPDIATPPVFVAIAIWVTLAAGAWFAWRKLSWGPWIAAGLVLLLPSSSIFPAADLAADRRMYLPIFAFAVGVAIGVVKLTERLRGREQPVAYAPGSDGKLKHTPPSRLVAVALLVVLSFLRTQVWMSDESLWREALSSAPQKVRPRIQLARDVPPPEALKLLAEAKQLAPQDPSVAAETGRVLMSAGNPAAALSEFGRALALDPRDANNFNNRGVALAALSQYDAARQDFQRALSIDPSLTSARENLRRTEGR